MELEFRAGEATESGVMLASPKEVADSASECYEVNIAPTSSGYPTGSLTGRLRSTDPSDSPDWRRMRVKVENFFVEQTYLLKGDDHGEVRLKRPVLPITVPNCCARAHALRATITSAAEARMGYTRTHTRWSARRSPLMARRRSK